MSLNIKTCIMIWIAILTLQISKAQDTDTIMEEHSVRFKYMGIYGGFSNYNVIGAVNSYNQGLNYNNGGEIKFVGNFIKGKIAEHIILGQGLSFTTADVTNIQEMGNYNSSNANMLKVIVGYGVSFSEKLEMALLFELGEMTYRSYTEGDRFLDSGFSFGVVPTLRYNVFEKVGLYASLNYQSINMNVQAPKIGDRDFSKNTLLVTTIGITFL